VSDSTATCAACGEKLDTSRDFTDERTPCPACGSSARHYSLHISDTVTVTDEVSTRVRRGVNEVRVAVLFVLLGVSIGVGVTAGFEQNSAILALMHWITGK
jgi:NAD-dependent SIR2 family protein deacetylase